ncbi:MAG: transcriptional regulator [Pseudolabrys sp.]
MSRGPKAGVPSHVDFLAKVRAAYVPLPDWVEELAKYASGTSATVAAKKIGYSVSAVSAVLAGKYKGDIGRVEAKVRGALMGETVECPVLGEIKRDYCLDQQKMPLMATSSVRVRVYRACRNGCPHSRIGGGS